MMNSVFDFLEYWATLHPNRLLFEFRDSRGQTTERHTFQSFQERTQSLAAHLMETSGLRSGDRVLLAYPPGLGTITALIACARAGLIGVPVALPSAANDANARRLRSIADDCGATALLSDGNHYSRLLRQLGTSDAATTLSNVLNTDDFPEKVLFSPRPRHETVLFLQYTSGSTGRPRGVIVSHNNVIANAKATLHHQPLIGVSWLPHHHDMGLIGYSLFPIVSGGTSYGFATADFLRRPALWVRLLSEVRATYTSSPNFGYEYCLRNGRICDSELVDVDLSSVQVLMNASEPARPRTVERFYQRFAHYGLRRSACTVAYGLAENTLTVALGGQGELRVDRAALYERRVEVTRTEDRATMALASCGKAAPGVTIGFRDVQSGVRLEGLTVGEICVAGDSVTDGYWNNDEATRHLFCQLDPRDGSSEHFLRTGDLGFLYRGELYVCGRLKDLIIVGGSNFFPDDLEAAIAASSAAVRPRGICAFQTHDGHVVILVEPIRLGDIPDPATLAEAVRRTCGLTPALLHIVPPRTVAITSSGKIARAETRALFVAGTVTAMATYRRAATGVVSTTDTVVEWRSAVRQIFSRHGITSEDTTLAECGIDSLTLAELHLELEDVLRRVGSGALAEALDASLLQHLSLRDLLSTLAPLDSGATAGAPPALTALTERRSSIDDGIFAQMLEDSRRPLPGVTQPRPVLTSKSENAILLTGATGFFGPFLLHELLQQTREPILVLVRATDGVRAMERVEAALQRARVLTPALRLVLRARVRPVCGDLSLPRWGLTTERWNNLARAVREVFHNGACVNYVLTYEAMHDTNVQGTCSALDLALDSSARALHLISSTFIFGWTAKETLLETDSNLEMQGLDFGYAQSKWVAERQAHRAQAHGLDVRVFRPSLISVSTQGAGDGNDVAIRMLSFMIRHRIAVDTSNQLSMVAADVVARNIVGISRLVQVPSPTFHVTADSYYSLTELTQIISRDYGYHFEYYDIPHFIDELNRRCAPVDPVYPLLNFFNRSAKKIAAMQLKRYSSVAYQQARGRIPEPLPDPSLAETASYLMRYLLENALIEPIGSARSV